MLSLADLENYDPRAPRGNVERRFCCPLCGDTKPHDKAHRSLAVNTRTGAWVCHRCQEKGKLKDFWTDKPLQLPKQRAQSALARAFALPSKASKREEPEVDWLQMWRESVPIEGTPGAGYVKRRGVGAEVAHEAGVRFSAKWYGRSAVLFPMYDKSGKMVAVNGRFVDGRDDPKTQSAGQKSLGLFITPGAFSQSPIAICEGAMDALSLWLCGVAAVALVGVTWPDWLLPSLAFKPVLIATDADEAGDAAARKLSAELIPRAARVFRLRPRGAKDWSELLETRGDGFMRECLAAFSEIADDEGRVLAVYDMARAGREDAARFIVSLISDPVIRELTLARMIRKWLARPELQVQAV